MKWKWANVPVPGQYLLGLILGSILQALLDGSLFQSQWIGLTFGLPLLIVGAGLCAWSVREAGDIEVEAPERLLTAGPYSLSRNPM